MRAGFGDFISSVRSDPAEGRTLGEIGAGAGLARSWYDSEPEPEAADADEREANLLARGYSPARLTGLARQHAETVTELQAEQEKLERDARRQERVSRDHGAGRISALDIARMDLHEGDPGRVAVLERRAASLRDQLEQVSQAASTPARDTDPLEAASRRAHQAFVEATRAKMSAARRRPRPFASVSRGAEHAGPGCPVCAAARAMSPAGGEITRTTPAAAFRTW